jgi:hypothetical protein
MWPVIRRRRTDSIRVDGRSEAFGHEPDSQELENPNQHGSTFAPFRLPHFPIPRSEIIMTIASVSRASRSTQPRLRVPPDAARAVRPITVLQGGKLGRRTITINRAPVLTLWASVVARRLGFARDEALTLGRAVAALNAIAKDAPPSLLKPSRKTIKERRRGLKSGKRLQVELLDRAVPVVRTRQGLRALSRDRPIAPDGVEQYLEIKFGDALKLVRNAMKRLARSMSAPEIAAQADELYEKFRPRVARGVPGWAAEGKLDVGRIERLEHPARAGTRKSATRP